MEGNVQGGIHKGGGEGEEDEGAGVVGEDRTVGDFHIVMQGREEGICDKNCASVAFNRRSLHIFLV